MTLSCQKYILLYIFRFLHQTTTGVYMRQTYNRCISFVSYIKPQRTGITPITSAVVYLSFPTSNHNVLVKGESVDKLYIFRFLHQTTTVKIIFLFLNCCISFVSYIKPQLFVCVQKYAAVVYLSFPTSNHNEVWVLNKTSSLYIFRFLHQTTTHSHYKVFI